jgi:hypothetical protein
LQRILHFSSCASGGTYAENIDIWPGRSAGVASGRIR